MKAKTATDIMLDEGARAARLSTNLSHLDPVTTFYNSDISYREPPNPGASLIEAANYSLSAATATVVALRDQILSYEGQLKSNEAIAILIIGGPAGLTFLPNKIFPIDPDKVVFDGLDVDGHPFRLVQHVSQLNFAMRVHLLGKAERRQPIGFEVPKGD